MMNAIVNPSNLNLCGLSGRIGSGKDLATKIFQYLTCKDQEIRNAFLENPTKTMQYYDGIVEMNSPYKNTKYSAKVKFIVAELLGVTIKKLEDKVFINAELGQQWWYYVVDGEKLSYLDPKFDENRESLAEFLVKLTPRKMMQLVGTEAGRDILHPDVWVNSTFAKYVADEDGNLPCWLVSDVRFPNELAKIHENGGFSIRLVRYKLFSEWLSTYAMDETIIELGGYEDLKISDVDFMDFINEYNSDSINEVIESVNHPSEVSLDGHQFHYTVDNGGTIEELVNALYEILIKVGVLTPEGAYINATKVIA